MSDRPWETSISGVSPNVILVRGYRIDELMGRVGFGQLVHLLLKGELPTPDQGRMIEAILCSSIDHGATPPSTLSARTVASTGAALNASVAAGILAISKHHGGAIEDCMRTLQDTVAIHRRSLMTTPEETAAELINSYNQQGKRVPGYGHRIHTCDPRTGRLFELAERYGIAGEYVEMAQALESQLGEISGKPLPINVDGAIAAVLCDMEFDPACANAFFMIARLPGMVAHVREEQATQKPMRRIDPSNHKYVGPEERPLPESLSEL